MLERFFFVCLLIYFIKVTANNTGCEFQQCCKRQVLFVLAHPDDEILFMYPTLRHHQLNNHSFSFLFFTNGDSEGLGQEREKELSSVMSSLSSPFYVIHHPDIQDSLYMTWNTTLGMVLLKEHVDKLRPTDIYTFDQKGVSSHPNHRSVYHIVRAFSQSSDYNIQYHYLQTVNCVRKYSGLLETLHFHPENEIHKSYALARNWKLMVKYSSQFTWFRKLFLVFSSYSYINSWELH